MPTVSIILPTYNRASFLPQALASIRAQQFTDWELLIVDDGSTDDTRQVIETLARDVSQPVRYECQTNQGAYAARNRAMEQAQGRYFAFFDSDDVWLPGHLSRLVEALDHHRELDVVFGPAKVLDLQSGQVVRDSSFFPDGKPRPFLSLRTITDGELRIIDDPELSTMAFGHGLPCGPQCMLARREVFDRLKFPPYRAVEDQLLTLLAVKAGFRFGYFRDEPTVEYYIHDTNSCVANQASSASARVALLTRLFDGLDWVATQVQLTNTELRALKQKISTESFWTLGYHLAQQGHIREAMPHFRRALRLNPWNVGFWKTYLKFLALSWVSVPA